MKKPFIQQSPSTFKRCFDFQTHLLDPGKLLSHPSAAQVPSQAAATSDRASSLTNTIKPQEETETPPSRGSTCEVFIAHKKEKKGHQ